MNKYMKTNKTKINKSKTHDNDNTKNKAKHKTIN